jgi:hypothetical protein
MALTTDKPEAQQPDVPRRPPSADQPLSPRNQQKAHALGLTSATGLVISSIVGTGVFTMPAVGLAFSTGWIAGDRIGLPGIEPRGGCPHGPTTCHHRQVRATLGDEGVRHFGRTFSRAK